jgi:2Fe-2S ferredoxin
MTGVQVIFKIADGKELETVIQPGERVLDAAWKLGLEEQGFGECGGNCSCATCHVLVEEGRGNLPPSSLDEEDLLDRAPQVQTSSRLACQLVASPDHDRIIVRLP